MEYSIITNGVDCQPWTETFVMWPRKSITGKTLFWTRAYKRRVWIVWSPLLHMEPEIQYATLFDILQDPYGELKEKQYSNDIPWGG